MNKFNVIITGLILVAMPYNNLQDTEPPSITNVNAEPHIQIVGGYVNITCVVIDNEEVDTVKVVITYPDNTTHNFTMLRMPPTPYYVPSHYYNSTYSMEGIYTFYIWANDTSGNSNTSSTYNFTITTDTTPPETYITSAPSGTICQHNVTFEWTGTDDQTPTSLLLYSYKLSGYDSAWSSWTHNTSATYTNLPDGTYTFMVKARDEAGNVDPTPAKAHFTIITDNSPPCISNINDNPDPQIKNGYVNITCTVTDNVGVAVVKVIIKTPTCCRINATMKRIECTNQYYYNATYTRVGKYYYHIWAKDICNNSNTSSTYNFTITTDTTPPETYITSAPSGTICQHNVTFEWTGTDDQTPTSLLLYSYKLSGYDSAWSSWTHNTSATYTNLPDGTYTFMVKARDEAGNVDPTPDERTFTITTDTSPPIVHIERPGHYIYIADRAVFPSFKPIIFGRITIIASAYDRGVGVERVDFLINGVLKKSVQREPYAWRWDEKAMGDYILTAIAYDKAGNYQSDSRVIFIINL